MTEEGQRDKRSWWIRKAGVLDDQPVDSDQVSITGPNTPPVLVVPISRVQFESRVAERLAEALRQIEIESCGDSDWTLERVHQALEAVYTLARTALSDFRSQHG